MVMYSSGVERMRAAYSVEVAIRKIVVLFVGPAGCGKTHLAHSFVKQVCSLSAPPEDTSHYPIRSAQIFGRTVPIYDKDPIHLWFSTYTGQPAIIMNEAGARGSTIPIGQYNRWLDTRTHEEQAKGSERHITAPVWIITSNREPADWWDNVDAPSLEALLGRLTYYYIFPASHTGQQACTSHCRGTRHPYRIWKHGLPDPIITPQRLPGAN